MYMYIFFPLQSKVGNVSFSVGPSQDELKKVHQVSLETLQSQTCFTFIFQGLHSTNTIFVLLSVSYPCKRPLGSVIKD